MGKRLIIQHGERTTRHVLSGEAVIIGRDPSCDLFFADQKLSRRHARIEVSTDGVKLTDLGSRNGSWVNEQRVDEYVLQPDDRVRLGRLQITIEDDSPPTAPSPAGDDATIMLSDTASGVEEGQTVRMDSLESAIPPTAEMAAPDGTVVFERTPEPDQERTVVLPGAPQPDEDSGTVMFQPLSEATTDTTTTALHVPAPAEGGIGREEQIPADELPPTAVGATADAVGEPSSAQAGHRFSPAPLLVVVVLSFMAYLLVAVPLVLVTRSSLRAESLARGRALVDLLAARNADALVRGDFQDLSVGSVGSEPGVEDALILDEEGWVLVPGDRSGELYEAYQGASKQELESDAIYTRRTKVGDYDLIRPIARQGESVGFAVLRYSGARVAERKSVPVLLFLGFLLIAGGTWGSYFLSKKQSSEQAATETTLSDHPNPSG